MLAYIDSSYQAILGSSAEIEMVREIQNFFQTPMSGIKFNNQVIDRSVKSNDIEFIRDDKDLYNIKLKSTASDEGVGKIVIGPFMVGDVTNASAVLYTKTDFDKEVYEDRNFYIMKLVILIILLI